ncbi:MAG: transglycosylase SLT domain-containing protein [Alphaproteobacteria bacterium]|nr:transglycosylase SLT domain-containing protein [Alphaproteobacteria bacterium]
MQVLSSQDAALYRYAFDAQEKGEWSRADLAIARIENRRLLGHLLADRYARRDASAGELQAWLTSYPDFPEAADIYDEIRRQPHTGKVSRPVLAEPWTGGDSDGSSFGFRTDAASKKMSGAVRNLTVKINRTLRRGDPYAAMVLLDNEQKRRPLSADDMADMRARIAAGFFYAGQTEHARKLTQESAGSQNPLMLWIGGLSAWKQGDIAGAGKIFAQLGAHPRVASWDKTAAQFWAYRALRRVGDNSQSRYWLEQAARQPRSFYGSLAAYLIGQDKGWSWHMPVLSAAHVDVLMQRPAGWRALALLQVGQRSLAESELQHLNPQGWRDLQEAMLALSESARMPSLAMQLGGIAVNADGRRYDAALYPLPPWQPEEGFQVDRALLYALMRHESRFDPEAVSGRGACGLMQLMPTTANLVANSNVTKGECAGRMLDPSFNMALGQRYVRHLASQPMIGDNLLLMLAAYNSGPGNLARWMDRGMRQDPLLFIESLPVRETRDYVQQVLTHYWSYRARLSEPTTSLAQLAHGEWPRYALHGETRPVVRAKAVEAKGFSVASK